MLRSILNTINRLSEARAQEGAATEKPQYTQEQLMQWAVACMREGLPDSFFSAWFEYKLVAPKKISLSYKYILNEGDEVQPFQPADDLYPAQCVEKLDAFLSEEKKNWVVCKLDFNPQTISLRYEY